MMIEADDILVWLLGHGMTLHAHGDYLYVQVGYDWTLDVPGHLHRLAPGLCPFPSCAIEAEEGLARLLVAQEADLRMVLASEPALAFTYDVPTATWHPEWMVVDRTGWPCVAHGAWRR
jgi:hypothetical protein